MFGIGLHIRAESIPRNQFRCSLNVYKFGLRYHKIFKIWKVNILTVIPPEGVFFVVSGSGETILLVLDLKKEQHVINDHVNNTGQFVVSWVLTHL